MELTGTRAKVGCFAAFVIAAVVLGYWKLAPGTEKPVESIVADLQSRSMPTGGRWLDKGELDFGRTSVTTSWEIEWDQGWDNYCQWIESRFGDFKIEKKSPDKKMHLVKHLPGDTLSIKIEVIGDSPLRVRVSFKGYPS